VSVARPIPYQAVTWFRDKPLAHMQNTCTREASFQQPVELSSRRHIAIALQHLPTGLTELQLQWSSFISKCCAQLGPDWEVLQELSLCKPLAAGLMRLKGKH